MLTSSSTGWRISEQLQMWFIAAAIIVIGSYAVIHGYTTPVVAVVTLGIIYSIYQRNRSLGVCIAVAFLILIGDERRVLGWLTEFPTNDPLLLVGPAFILLAVLPALIHIRLRDTMSKLVLALGFIMVLQIFNPGQGGLAVGLSGALFFIPQLLWFWLGRNYGSEAIVRRLIFRVVIPLATLAALLGYYQVYVGETPWEHAWVLHSGYAALYIGGKSVRAIGFSTSGQEYTDLLLIGSYFCVAQLLRRRWIFTLPMAVLLPAIVLASSRGGIVRFALAVTLAWTLSGKQKATRPLRFAIALVVVIGAITFLVSKAGSGGANTDKSNASSALAHDTNGLAHPLDQRYSTVGLHSQEIVAGTFAALKHPIGYGIGETTGASRFSNSGQLLMTEFDLTDSFVDLGVPGGLIYLAIFGLGLLLAYRYSQFGAPDLRIAIVIFFAADAGSWMYTGEYGNVPILWFLLGTVTALVYEREQQTARLQAVNQSRRSTRAPVSAGLAAARASHLRS
jgi:hypothetical protein